MTVMNSVQNRVITTQHPFNGLFSRTSWVSQHQKGSGF